MSTALRARHTRVVATVTVGLLGLGGLTSCTDNEPTGDSAPPGADEIAEPGRGVSPVTVPQLNVGLLGEVPSLDPTLRSSSSYQVYPLGMESLLRIDSEGRLAPWLASEWEQTSPTEYVYRLRQGVEFWDGSELTSSDVKFSWDYFRRPESVRANFFSSVEEIETPDRYTVRVRLRQPDASWQFTPAMYYAVVFQKTFAEANAGSFGQPRTLVMATGPWEFESLNPTSSVELAPHESYWGGAPPVQDISIRFFDNDNSMALALRSGEIDLAPSVNSPTGFDPAAGGGTITTASTCGTATLSIPTQSAPWDDIHVRRAVAHAINREEVAAASQGSAAEPLDTLIPTLLLKTVGSEDAVAAGVDALPTYAHDLEAAREEMAQSRVPDGFSSTISVLGIWATQAEVLAAQLEEIGIDLTIETPGDTAWFSQATGPAGERPLTFVETNTCSPDPSWYDLYLGSDSLEPGGLNLANYAPPDVDDLLAEGLATQDPDTRLDIYLALLERIAEDVPYVPIYAEGTTYASTKFDMVDYGSYWNSLPWALNVRPR